MRKHNPVRDIFPLDRPRSRLLSREKGPFKGGGVKRSPFFQDIERALYREFWDFLAAIFGLEEEEKWALLLPFALESGYAESSGEPSRATPRLLLHLTGISYSRVRELFHPRGKLHRFRLLRYVKGTEEYPLLDRPYGLPEALMDRLCGLKPWLEGVEELPASDTGQAGPLAGRIVSLARKSQERGEPFLLELIGERETALLALEEALAQVGLPAWSVSLPEVGEEGLGEILREALLEGRLVVLTEADRKELPRDLLRDLALYLVLVAERPLGFAEHRLGVPSPSGDYLAGVFRQCGLSEAWPFPVCRRDLKKWIRAGLTPEEILLEKYRRRAQGLALVRKPCRSPEELVLPEREKRLLDHLLLRLRRRTLILEDEGLARLAYPRKGVNVLFSGPPGTGKTLAAEILAGSLGLPLVMVDLAGVASKWVGETEKNLRLIFEDLVSPETVVVFDEAEALFGRRVENRQAQDRYANMEISYLLQRLEDHRGCVILATNLEPALDQAFVRRLDLILRFPFPDEEMRERLWRQFLARLPRTRGIEVTRLAREYPLSGGQIRNIVLTAAYLAGEGPVGPEEIKEALELELTKLGAMLEAR